MAEYVTLIEAAELEGVKYKTMAQRLNRNPDKFDTMTEKSENGGKDAVLVAVASLSKKARNAWKERAKLKELSGTISPEGEAQPEPEAPWYVEADVDWYIENYREQWYKGMELGNVIREFLQYDGANKTEYAEDNSGNADENISSKKSETENASAVLHYFRHCGWISERELGRNGDNIATVMPYCRKMMDAIERIFNRENSAALTNQIFAIYDILSSAFKVDHARNIRPYSNILVPVSDHVSDLKNELLILKDSIRSIMRVVIKMTETNALGQFLLRDEMMQTFFNDYFFIKKDGLIPGYIDEIERMLRRLVTTESFENMITEYENLYDVTEIQAREIVEAQFDEIKSFISYDYVKEMDYIDKKINSYYSLYSTRILMVLSNKVNMQTYLNNLLMQIKNMGTEERNVILTEISKSFTLESYKYVGRKSIERRKKRNPNTKSATVVKSALSDEERARLTNELLYEYPDRYGVKQVTDYFEKLFKDEKVIEPDKELVKTRDDAMMIAASIIYSGSADFPYEVEFLDGTIETEIATISNIRIRRRTK